MRPPLAREGLPLCVFFLLIALGSLIFFRLPLSLVPLLPLALILFFFREPRRPLLTMPGKVLSPADGRVWEIEEVEEVPFFGGKGTRVSIFLSLFDAHVTRSPIDGQVLFMEYREGKFVNAMSSKAPKLNEQKILGLAGQNIQVSLKKIAGLFARRIRCHCSLGEWLKRGQRLGIIMFGSRVEIFLPPSCQITVRKGEKVKAGITIIGEYHEKS